MVVNNFGYYNSVEDNEEIRVMVELDAIDFAPDYDKNILLWLHLKTTDKKVYQSIFDNILKNYKVIFVGTIQRGDWIEWYGYSYQAKGFEKAIKDGLKNYKITYEFGSHKDKYWNHYKRVLYPNKEQKQLIENYDIIQELTSNQIDLSKEYLIEHYFQFKSEENRVEFVDILQKDGYNFVEEYYDDEAFALKYGLVMQKSSYIQQKPIDIITIYLMQQVKNKDGVYVGWGLNV